MLEFVNKLYLDNRFATTSPPKIAFVTFDKRKTDTFFHHDDIAIYTSPKTILVKYLQCQRNRLNAFEADIFPIGSYEHVSCNVHSFYPYRVDVFHIAVIHDPIANH